MYYARTDELKTFWTHYHCDDPNCPGKLRNSKRMEARHRWVTDGSDDSQTGAKGMKTHADEKHLRYSPGYFG